MAIKVSIASANDTDKIYRIIKPYSEENIILKRTREDITNSINTFLVAKDDEEIVGVVSYYDYGAGLKEIRSLSVPEKNVKKGIGSLLLKEIIEKIKAIGESKIFVLTYSPGFFIKNKFETVERNTLPEKIWKDCDNCKKKDRCDETALIYKGD